MRHALDFGQFPAILAGAQSSRLDGRKEVTIDATIDDTADWMLGKPYATSIK